MPADLNRAQDTPVATNRLMEITPINWHRYPPRAEDATRVYVPTIAYTGGVKGDDVDEATAATTTPYTPKTQAEKATAMGLTLAEDISAPRGWIEPSEPYAAKPAAPTVASISPTTGASAALPLLVTITGTGFTPYSSVYTGGALTPEFKSQYVSPTQMKVPIWAAAPGTVSVVVEDHNVKSNTNILFTVT